MWLEMSLKLIYPSFIYPFLIFIYPYFPLSLSLISFILKKDKKNLKLNHSTASRKIYHWTLRPYPNPPINFSILFLTVENFHQICEVKIPFNISGSRSDKQNDDFRGRSQISWQKAVVRRNWRRASHRVTIANQKSSDNALPHEETRESNRWTSNTQLLDKLHHKRKRKQTNKLKLLAIWEVLSAISGRIFAILESTRDEYYQSKGTRGVNAILVIYIFSLLY